MKMKKDELRELISEVLREILKEGLRKLEREKKKPESFREKIIKKGA